MAIQAKAVRRGAYVKKRQAAHHHISKHYLKAYWPYLPILTILGFGFLISYYLNVPTHAQPGGSNVSFSSNSMLETIIGGLALSIFLVRHGFAWRKVWVKSEDFAVKHPMLDIGLVSVATISALLVQASFTFR